MKVRHKFLYPDLKPIEVREESESCYIIKEGSHYEALPKSCYEPIPTEQWRDVTGECEVDGDKIYPFAIRHNGKIVNNCGHEISNYRLRKVQLYSAPQYDGTGRCIQAAFLVERKESHD